MAQNANQLCGMTVRFSSLSEGMPYLSSRPMLTFVGRVPQVGPPSTYVQTDSESASRFSVNFSFLLAGSVGGFITAFLIGLSSRKSTICLVEHLSSDTKVERFSTSTVMISPSWTSMVLKVSGLDPSSDFDASFGFAGISL